MFKSRFKRKTFITERETIQLIIENTDKKLNCDVHRLFDVFQLRMNSGSSVLLKKVK